MFVCLLSMRWKDAEIRLFALKIVDLHDRKDDRNENTCSLCTVTHRIHSQQTQNYSILTRAASYTAACLFRWKTARELRSKCFDLYALNVESGFRCTAKSTHTNTHIQTHLQIYNKYELKMKFILAHGNPNISSSVSVC